MCLYFCVKYRNEIECLSESDSEGCIHLDTSSDDDETLLSPKKKRKKENNNDDNNECKNASNNANNDDDNDDEKGLCVVCQDTKADHVVIPCGHLVLCKECVNDLDTEMKSTCVLCRANVTNIIKIYTA